MDWRMEMEKVAVFPVPDCAWAITSRPLVMGRMARCWIAEGFSKSARGEFVSVVRSSRWAGSGNGEERTVRVDAA